VAGDSVTFVREPERKARLLMPECRCQACAPDAALPFHLKNVTPTLGAYRKYGFRPDSHVEFAAPTRRTQVRQTPKRHARLATEKRSFPFAAILSDGRSE